MVAGNSIYKFTIESSEDDADTKELNRVTSFGDNGEVALGENDITRPILLHDTKIVLGTDSRVLIFNEEGRIVSHH